MTENDELIARQAKAIYELQDRVEELQKRIQGAIMNMVCIGGPLNDNKLDFNKEQRQVFLRILKELEG